MRCSPIRASGICHALVDQDKERSLEEILLDLRQDGRRIRGTCPRCVAECLFVPALEKTSNDARSPRGVFAFRPNRRGERWNCVSQLGPGVRASALHRRHQVELLDRPWNPGRQTPWFDQLDESSPVTEAEMEERQRIRPNRRSNDPSLTALMIPFETLSSDTRTVISST